MMAASCVCGIRVGVSSRVVGGQPSQARLLHPQVRAAPSLRPRRASLRCMAFKGGNGNKEASQDQQHATKMINLVTAYFDELMTKGNTNACSEILDPRSFRHKDMVRNEGRYGIEDYAHYIRELKSAYPDIYVKPVQFGVVNDHTLFVAFEGKATPHTETFKGVDLFYFDPQATRIQEIEVYRSNWLGAQGHEERKKLAQRMQDRQEPRIRT